MSGPAVGHVDHQTTVSTHSNRPDSFVYAEWHCSCGDRQAGYLKRRYAEDDARMHAAASTPTARREAGE